MLRRCWWSGNPCCIRSKRALILTFSQGEKELPLLWERVGVRVDWVCAAICAIAWRNTCFSSPRNGHGKDSPLVYFHFRFLETCRAHEFIHFRRGAPPHD